MPWQINPENGEPIFISEDGSETFDMRGEKIESMSPMPVSETPVESPDLGQTTDIGPVGTSDTPRTQLPGQIQTDNQAQINQILDLLRPLTNPETINKLEEARLGRELQLAEKYGGLARSRDIEMQNIRSWQAIQVEQIKKEAQLAASLATTAYLANTPNANTMAALTNQSKSASAAFK